MISPILPMILLILSIITTLAVERFGSHEHGELVSKLSANGQILHKPQSLHCSFKRYSIPHFNEFYSCAVYTKSENPMKGTD